MTSRGPLHPEGVCDCVLSMQGFFPTGLTLFSSVDTAPAAGTLNAAAAVSTKELIDNFLKKPREELLQCKTPNVTLLEDELSVLTELVLCVLCSYLTKILLRGFS